MEQKKYTMIDNGTMRVGGNTLKVWLWDFFAAIGVRLEKFGNNMSELGKKMSLRNKPKAVTNPSAKLINPFTMMVTFTVDVNDKYQIVLQGDYKQQYKDCVDGVMNISEENVFMIINQHQKEWFKKD
jgi:hypothetical protein